MVSNSTEIPPVIAAKKRRQTPFLIGMILLVITLVGCAVYFFVSSSGAKDWRKNTVKVESGAVDVRIEATGTIKPVNEVKVSPKVTGLIKKLLVKQGDVVSKGQVLALMDDSNLQGQIEAARGNYLMAQDTH